MTGGARCAEKSVLKVTPNQSVASTRAALLAARRLLFDFLTSVPPWIPTTTNTSHPGFCCCYASMALFSKRLTCHGCGKRPIHPIRGPVRQFHCEHCGYDNFLDQVRAATHQTTRKRLTINLERRDRRSSNTSYQRRSSPY